VCTRTYVAINVAGDYRVVEDGRAQRRVEPGGDDGSRMPTTD
jgi:hypothetical protein